MWSGRMSLAAGTEGDGDPDAAVDAVADAAVDRAVDVLAGFVRADWQPARVSETMPASIRIRAGYTMSMIPEARAHNVR